MPKINRPKKASARSVRLDQWMLDAIRAYAYQTNRTEGDAMRHLIADGLRREGFAEPAKVDDALAVLKEIASIEAPVPDGVRFQMATGKARLYLESIGEL